MATKSEKPQLPHKFSVAEIRKIADGLMTAATHLESAIAEMNGGEQQTCRVESAFLHLTHLQNTLLPKVKVAAEDAHTQAVREREATEVGVESERTKSVMRHFKSQMRAWEALQSADAKPQGKKGPK